MTFYPTISVQVLPGLQVDTNVLGLSYASIIAALGPISLLINTLYYDAATISQFANPIDYVTYDSNGSLQKQAMAMPVNANQFYPSMYLPTRHRDYEFNGQNKLNFNLLVGQTINFIMYGNRINIRDLLSALGIPDNFEVLQKQMGIPGFYDDYEDILE